MMKKIFSKYFVVAVVAVAMGCISSCKDFEDEMYSALDGQDANLRKHFTEEIEKLRQDMEAQLDQARKEREALQTALNNHIADANAKFATKEELTQTKTNLEGQLATLKQELQNADAANKAELQGQINTINGELTTITNNIETIKKDITTINNKIIEAAGKISTLEGKVSTLEGKVSSIETTYAKLTDLKDWITKTEAEKYTDATELAAEHKAIIEEVKVMIANAEPGSELYETIMAAVNAAIDDALDELGGDNPLATLVGTATDAADSAAVNAANIAALKELVDSLNSVVMRDTTALNELKLKVDTLSGIEETKALALAAQEKAIEMANEYTDLAVDAMIANTERRFHSIEQLLAEMFTQTEEQKDWLIAHDDSIAALRADVEDLKKRVEKNEQEIEKLTETSKDVVNALLNRISSVVLQATKSPVVGYFNMPMGIKSNVLAAYYGEAMNNVYFPTVRTANLISGEAFTEAEAALLGFSEEVLYEQGEVLIDEAEGNAGTLYVTINPAEVDTTGVDFALVNSLEETSYVTLGDFNESTEKLTFGYTRAANGFYEAKATITAENAANAKVRVGMDDLKGIASNLKNNGLNLTNIAFEIQSVINDIADANAVKASWEDSMGLHNVYSEYALAAMTVQPLSYQFMQNYEMKNFPGLTRVSNFINSTIDKINIALPKFDMDFNAPEIKKIAIKDFDELGVNCIIDMNVEYELNMTVPVEDVVIEEQTVIVPGQTITVPVKEQIGYGEINGEKVEVVVPATTVEVVVDGTSVTVDEQVISIKDVVVKETLQIPVKYDMTDIIKDLYGNVTEPIEDVNAMLGDLESFMDDVNKMLEELDSINDLEQSITDAKNDIKSQLNKYLDLLNKKLCGAINSIHDRLQPNLLLKTEDGFAMLSQVKNKPTVLEAANCVVVPTSYTGELLVPAFKKYVAVVNVKDAEGNDVTSSEIASVNTGDLNKVLAGSTDLIEFAGKSGYTYEIVYSALDYSGKYSNARYYVTVK